MLILEFRLFKTLASTVTILLFFIAVIPVVNAEEYFFKKRILSKRTEAISFEGLGNNTQAKQSLTLFVTDYSAHPLAEDARALIQQLP